MRLELGEIEVPPVPAVVAQEVEAEVEQRPGDRGAVDLEVALLEVPAPRPDEEHGHVVVQCVALLARVESMVRSSASVRLRCPSMQFSHVGEFASSKSAMNTRAPELSALITIFRSTGPVISTRRSAISSGNGAIRQSPRARRRCPGGSRAARLPEAPEPLPRASSSRRRSPNSRWRSVRARPPPMSGRRQSSSQRCSTAKACASR